MTAGPGASSGTTQAFPFPATVHVPAQPMNWVELLVTPCDRLTLVELMNAKVQTPGQSIPGGLLTIRPSLFAVTLMTVTVAPLKLMTYVNGALATPPTLSVIEVRTDVEP